jgi:hypothetical protein
MTDAQEVEPCGKGRSPPLRFRGVNAWAFTVSNKKQFPDGTFRPVRMSLVTCKP